MNDELIKSEALIKRIDEQMKAIKPYDKNGYRSVDFDIHALLYDCRAALTEMPRAVAYVDNSSLEELKRELCSGIMVGSFSERHNRTKPLYEAPHDNAALSRKYVPMTGYELSEIYFSAEQDDLDGFAAIQTEVIRRAGLEVSE